AIRPEPAPAGATPVTDAAGDEPSPEEERAIEATTVTAELPPADDADQDEGPRPERGITATRPPWAGARPGVPSPPQSPRAATSPSRIASSPAWIAPQKRSVIAPSGSMSTANGSGGTAIL